MNDYLNKKFKSLFYFFMKFIRPDINNLKFFLGQSAILSSRSISHNFNDLWDAEVKVFSQWGEDGILDFICEKIGISKPNVIEIGAANFIECNSRFIAEFRNANVILVDCRSDLTKAVETSSLYWKSTLIPIVEFVTPDNINKIIQLGEKKIGKINIFSIDLDGNDYWILQKANLSQVDIVLLEYNPIFGPKLEVSVPRNDEFDRYQSHYSGLYYGASLKAFIELMNIKGFNFIGTNRVGNNAFFVQNKFLGRFDFDLTTDYEKYVDWRIRESRDTAGALTFLSGRERLELISSLPLLDLKTNRVSTIKKLFSIND